MNRISTNKDRVVEMIRNDQIVQLVNEQRDVPYAESHHIIPADDDASSGEDIPEVVNVGNNTTNDRKCCENTRSDEESNDEEDDEDDDDDSFSYHISMASLADAACLTLSSASSVIEREAEIIRKRLYSTRSVDRSFKRQRRTYVSSQNVHLSSHHEDSNGEIHNVMACRNKNPKESDEIDDTAEYIVECESHAGQSERVNQSAATSASILRQINRMKRMSKLLQRIDCYQMKLLAEVQNCCHDDNNEDQDYEDEC
jgi:hypothetical protein